MVLLVSLLVSRHAINGDTIMALSDIKTKNAKAKAAPYKLTDGDGMYLQVQPNGSKYWRFNYRFAGKQKTLALGTYPAVGLSSARKKRHAAPGVRLVVASEFNLKCRGESEINVS
jgi:hypothetical protein